MWNQNQISFRLDLITLGRKKKHKKDIHKIFFSTFPSCVDLFKMFNAFISCFIVLIKHFPNVFLTLHCIR